MPCDVETVAEAACASGIGKVWDEIKLLQIIAQNLIGLTGEASCPDPDAEAFFERAGITDATQMAAINTLVNSAKANGWWNFCDIIYPFVGGTAAAHAENLKSSDFTITWNGTVTHDANGVTGNGTDGYGATGYIPASSGQVELNSAHISCYQRAAGSTNRGIVGCFDGTRRFVFRTGNTTNSRRNGTLNGGAEGAAIINTVNGLLSLNAEDRFDATNVHGYVSEAAGVPTFVDRTTASASTGIPTAELYVLAFNNNGTAADFQDANLALITVGTSIGFTIFQTMYADIEAFQTTLGRAV